MRSCGPRLQAAGLAPEPAVLHGFTDPDYFVGTAERGVDALVAAGEINDDEADELRAEIGNRRTNGSLYGHMLYASTISAAPEH